MQFAHPHLLWLLLVIPPALLGLHFWSERKRRQLATQFVHARLLERLLSGLSETRRKIRLASFLGAIMFIIIALARPQWGFTWEEVKQRGLDIVIAIDSSKSMLADDIKPNRLTRAKLAALDLVQLAKSDRIGLVAFAGSAFLQCPLTIDDSVFRQSLDSLDVNVISRGGTAVSEAIKAGLGAFDNSENYKVLVLFTDGEDHDSGALDTAREAAKKGLQIFAIGVGTAEGELLRAPDDSGKIDFIRDERGNVVKSRLNEPFLQQLAGITDKGFYLPLRGAGAMDVLYNKGLAPLPKSESGEKLVKRYHEQYHLPLIIAILLLAFEMLYPERTSKAKAALRQSASAGLPLTVSLCLVCIATGTLRASPGSALKSFEAGQYGKSLSKYQELLKKRPDDPRLLFNAGAAAYKQGEFGQAADYFNKSIGAEDLKLQQQAYYNRGNSLFEMGDAIPEPAKKQELWQRSLQDFESALKLNPKDPDAAHNRDYVKQRIEELKQQQQQQQQQKDQKKDQDQQQKDQQQEQQQQDQQQQEQQHQEQQQKQDQQQQQNQQGEEKDQKHPGEQPEQSPEQKKDRDSSSQPDQKPGEEEKKPDQPQPGSDQQKQQDQLRGEPEESEPIAGQMSPQQARRMLDAEKGDEKILQFKVPEDPSRPRPMKDW